MHLRWIKTKLFFYLKILKYWYFRCHKTSRVICIPSRIHQGAGIPGYTGPGTDQWMSCWSRRFRRQTRFDQMKYWWVLTFLFPVTKTIQGHHHLQSCWPANQPARSQSLAWLPWRSRSDPGSVLWTFKGTRMSRGSPHHWTLCPCSGSTYGILCFAKQSGKIFSIRKLWLLN